MQLSTDTANTILGQMNFISGFEWASVVGFLVFVGALGFTLLGAWKQVQAFRSRRINPLMQEGKALMQSGTETGKLLMNRGMSIYNVSMSTADSVGIRAQTTANVVKGAIPEAKRLPTEVSAATDDIRTTMKTAQTVRTTLRAVQTVRAVTGAVKSVSGLLKAIGRGKDESAVATEPVVIPTATVTAPPTELSEPAAIAMEPETRETVGAAR